MLNTFLYTCWAFVCLLELDLSAWVEQLTETAIGGFPALGFLGIVWWRGS